MATTRISVVAAVLFALRRFSMVDDCIAGTGLILCTGTLADGCLAIAVNCFRVAITGIAVSLKVTCVISFSEGRPSLEAKERLFGAGSYTAPSCLINCTDKTSSTTNVQTVSGVVEGRMLRPPLSCQDSARCCVGHAHSTVIYPLPPTN